MICRPKNDILLKAILSIVFHVSNNFYGLSEYDVTGPKLIGQIAHSARHSFPPMRLTHYGPKGNEVVRLANNNEIVLDHYPEYRMEQFTSSSLKYYSDSWQKKDIYEPTTRMQLENIYSHDQWSTGFRELIQIGKCTHFMAKQRIYIFLPYYGSFPNYFQLYLDSLGINTDILTVFLLTDLDTSSFHLPENLILIPFALDEIRERLSTFIFKNFGQQIEPKALLQTNYKLVDIKIIYSLLFDDILQRHHVTERDFVGYGDCDVIYGKLSDFIKFTNTNYEIIGGWHGHLTAIKNTFSFKNLFTKIPNYLTLVTDNTKTYITDEIAYREPLVQYLKENNFEMFYANAYFCDIVPPCFYYMFRPDHASRVKNWFDVYNSKNNITYLFYDKERSKLVVKYDEDSVFKEILYCHLQKRKMDLPFQEYEIGYYIHENSFSLPHKLK